MSVEDMTQRAERTDLAALYAEVQQFYAQHMHHLDRGEAEEWAATFTADGVFAPPSAPEPVRGRAALAQGVREAVKELAEAGETRRHILTMLAVRTCSDGSLAVRSYAQIVATPHGGTPALFLMCVCEDILVRQGGRLLVKERRVTRDDRP
ncbi:nuclear transport factor 2 family protein [Streptomyces griseus]|uniref:nuclear transport factor 2 family protein n=1 Tax=Streptomyces griseus TaxID=1911 RepID=UPI0005692328|nr:nuclear transport factor 2 family protein [Streptomyces griseus]